jgi:FtsH-binding integral membrane protein
MNSNKSNKSNKSNLANKRKRSIFRNDISQVFKLISEKRSFFALILANLLVQLYITYYVSENVKVDDDKKEGKKFSSKFIAAFIASIVIILILVLVPMPAWLKFIFFSLFSGIFGILLGYRKYGLDPNVIKTAFVGTASIFVSMFIFGLALIMSGIQLGYKTALVLFFALLALIIVSIVQIFIVQSSLLKKIIVIGSLILFSIYIVYDTNSILQRDYAGDFITASLNYYLDLINIFSALLGDSGLSD